MLILGQPCEFYLFLGGERLANSRMMVVQLRAYFRNHYSVQTVHGTDELRDIFTRLPVSLRDELAGELGYIDSRNGLGRLSQVGRPARSCLLGRALGSQISFIGVRGGPAGFTPAG